MELGGNKNAKAFYEKNGMMPQGAPPDHKNPTLQRYKNDLKIRAAKAIGLEQPQGAAIPQVPVSQPLLANKSETNFGGNNIVL
jgi:hypothetical protein